MKIVIIDDRPDHVFYAVEMLERKLENVQCVIYSRLSEFEEALLEFAKDPPVVFVCDMLLDSTGIQSGLKCLRTIFANPLFYGIPIVVHSHFVASEFDREIHLIRQAVPENSAIITISPKSAPVEALVGAIESLLSAFTQKLQLQSESSIFVVHGHDHGAKDAVARFIERLDGKAIILQELANSGSTIIEKFESNSRVSYAVILLTPDDSGSMCGGESRFRARQNVIYEMGFFAAKLGRRHMCILAKGDLEVPSDMDSLICIPMDQAGAWKISLLREFKAAGIKLNYEKAYS